MTVAKTSEQKSISTSLMTPVGHCEGCGWNAMWDSIWGAIWNDAIRVWAAGWNAIWGVIWVAGWDAIWGAFLDAIWYGAIWDAIWDARQFEPYTELLELIACISVTRRPPAAAVGSLADRQL